jgi:hypothetical protein
MFADYSSVHFWPTTSESQRTVANWRAIPAPHWEPAIRLSIAIRNSRTVSIDIALQAEVYMRSPILTKHLKVAYN